MLANERVNVNAVNKVSELRLGPLDSTDSSRCLQDGESSLLIAARYGHVDVVHVLLDRGASTTLQDQVGSPSSPSASLIFTWRL